VLAVAGPGPVRARPHALPVDAVLRAAVAEAEPGGSGGPPTPPALSRRGHGDPAGRLVPLGDGDTDAAGPSGTGRRVDLLTTGDGQVAGPAAVDLIHLLAELLDNAAAFSPPMAPIVVTGAADGVGYLVEVADRGLGMTDQELTWANQRLAGPGPAAGLGAASRRRGPGPPPLTSQGPAPGTAPPAGDQASGPPRRRTRHVGPLPPRRGGSS
jgi:hypothetical protein